MAGDLVLITGGNGLVGYRTIVHALKAGYRVVAPLRSLSKADAVLSAPSIKALNPGSALTFVEVPDIIVPGAYDEAVQGAKYVIHGAASIRQDIPPEQWHELLVAPAIEGAAKLLESARKSGTVKRVVLINSASALVPFETMLSGSDSIFDSDSKVGPKDPPYRHEFEAYADSKVRLMNASYDFVEKRKPGFDVINVFPSFVLGRHELQLTKEDFFSGTNAIIVSMLLGHSAEAPRPGSSVALEDTAKVLVGSLDESRIKGNQNYIAASPEAIVWESAKKIAEKAFPQAFADGLFSSQASAPTAQIYLDVSKTEKAFGMKFQPFDEQVKDVAQSYLDRVPYF